MGKSYRKSKIFGNTMASSEKDDKRFANRKYRRKVRMLLDDGEEDISIDIRDVSEIYSFAKDGKTYWADAPKKEMRK